MSGKFTFDTATTALSMFQLTFKGDSALAGTYTNTSNLYVANYNLGFPELLSEGLDAEKRPVGVVLVLSGLGNPYEILDGSRNGSNFGLLPQDGQNPPTSVVTVTAPTVPEPSS